MDNMDNYKENPRSSAPAPFSEARVTRSNASAAAGGPGPTADEARSEADRQSRAWAADFDEDVKAVKLLPPALPVQPDFQPDRDWLFFELVEYLS